MEETVTLKLGRYEALRDKARRVDVLEKENAELREKLNGTPHGEWDGSKLIYSIYADEIKVDEKCVDVFSKVKEEECSEKDEKDGVTINGKSVKDILKENEMLHKMGVFKHYAKGGVTTKSELADQSPFPMLKRSKKKK